MFNKLDNYIDLVETLISEKIDVVRVWVTDYASNYLEALNNTINEFENNLFRLSVNDREIYIYRILNHIFKDNRQYILQPYKELSQEEARILTPKEVTKYFEEDGYFSQTDPEDSYYAYFIDYVNELFIHLQSLLKDFGVKCDPEHNPMLILLNIKLISSREQKANFEHPYTTPRQVLAIQTLLSELNVVGLDRTVLTQFIQFLTTRQPNSIPKNTSIYKYIPNLEDRSTYNADCEFVAKQFDLIGLNIIADKIRRGKEEKK